MRALSRNSKWTSKKYSQEAGENNWALATPKIEARHPRITLDSESSATELVSYQNLDVETGDKLLVKLSDGNYHEVVVESVAKNNPAGTFEISREIDDNKVLLKSTMGKGEPQLRARKNHDLTF